MYLPFFSRRPCKWSPHTRQMCCRPEFPTNYRLQIRTISASSGIQSLRTFAVWLNGPWVDIFVGMNARRTRVPANFGANYETRKCCVTASATATVALRKILSIELTPQSSRTWGGLETTKGSEHNRGYQLQQVISSSEENLSRKSSFFSPLLPVRSRERSFPAFNFNLVFVFFGIYSMYAHFNLTSNKQLLEIITVP